MWYTIFAGGIQLNKSKSFSKSLIGRPFVRIMFCLSKFSLYKVLNNCDEKVLNFYKVWSQFFLAYLLFVNDGSADRRRPYLLATFLQLLPSVLFCFKGMRGFQSSAPLNHVSRLDVSRKTKKHTVWTIKCDTFSKVWVTENLTKRNSVLLLSLVRFSTTQTLPLVVVF